MQLITYPDSLGGDLRALDRVLQTHFLGLFEGGIHILPPFPSSGDRGFAPVTYLDIAPEFGRWEDIRRLGQWRPVLLDLMVNHLSAGSVYFQDFLENGRKSEFADLFLSVDKIWPGGDIPRDEMEAIFLRRREPFSDFTLKGTGEVVRLWTTFGKTSPSEQIDIDVRSAIARRLLTEFMRKFAENGVSIVRLDAVGFVTKKRRTSWFFVEPDIYHFLEWISGVADSLGLDVLPEVHADPTTTIKLAERGYWIYDFILPYMVLEALLRGSATKLKEYLKTRPHRQFTMLDCHDGIPVKPDLNGLYRSEDVRKVVSICLERGANLSRVYSPRHRDPDGFDVHQIRGTFYSLLGSNDEAYLAARAIQMFTPGVPQVYYVGLLAGENDPAAAVAAGDGREINRHNYSMDEVERNLQRPVVQRLVKLIRFRNEHRAFDGEFRVLDSDDAALKLSWDNGRSSCQLTVDFKKAEAVIRSADDGGNPGEDPL
ncbi:MAG TPA: sucrose phosphorylase [Anaerolineales bacterium]|nr:sucrose phosphorylase [Anaerolineales bacterium]